MVKFEKNNDLLLLEYKPQNGSRWILDSLRDSGFVTIKKTYLFKRSDLYAEDSALDEEDEETVDHFGPESVIFRVAVLVDGYYRFEGRILSITNDVYICKDFKFQHKTFSANRNISIFRKIDDLVSEDIWIGHDEKCRLPVQEFLRLIKSFPNSNELDKYAKARVGSIIGDYFETKVDAVGVYEKYINKKPTHRGENLIDTFRAFEKVKYERILTKLKLMLGEQESYNEKQWQTEILQILLILYPKYICVFDEVTIRDTENNIYRRLDYMLVGSNGAIDIVEIKRPFARSIMSQATYRDNYIPLRELAGSVMQIEKYIYYLNKWGRKGEEILTRTYKDQLPQNLRIRVVNPEAIIIMGRDESLTEEQRTDLEFVKRKYKNVMDIITYDDLMARLEILVAKFSSEFGRIT